MKQLDFNVHIEKNDDPDFPYVMVVRIEGEPSCTSWFRGKTRQDVIDMFYEALSNKQTRYWYMMEDK